MQWRNRLVWADKKYALPSLVNEFAGAVDLIYIDPPFDTGANFALKTAVPDSDESFVKEPSIIEHKAYRDTWGRGLDSYLQWFRDTVALLSELLSPKGSIYVHLDWHVGHYAKVVLDEVFGPDNFINEIAWCYEDVGGKATNYFKRKHDTIFLYQKSAARTFNVFRKKLSESTIKRYGEYLDGNGQITYRQLKKSNPGVFATLKGVRDLDEVWLDINKGAPLNDWWPDISPLKIGFKESTGYPTQKPEALLQRILECSSDPGDLVLDCFCGSGTTLAMAEKMQRRWVGCDLSRFAVHTTRKRLLELTGGIAPFIV